MTMVAAGVALYGAYSASQASGAQADAANRSAELSNTQYQQTRSDFAPYRQSGAAANARLMALLGIGGGGAATMAAPVAPSRDSYWTTQPGQISGMYGDVRGPGGVGPSTRTFDQTGYEKALTGYNSAMDSYNASAGSAGVDSGSLLRPFTGADVANEPGYQFGLSEGNKGIDRAASAAGRYDSGATLKALTRYGQDYAGTKYNEAFGRDQANKNMTYNFLSGQSGQGLNATTMTGNAGSNALAQGNMARANAGDATAAGYIGGANALTGGLNSYLQNQNNQQTLKYLLSRNAGSGTGWNTASNYSGSFNPSGGTF